VAGRLVRVAKLRRAARSYLLSYGYSKRHSTIAHLLNRKAGCVLSGSVSALETRFPLRLLPIGGVAHPYSELVSTMAIGEAWHIGRSAISTLTKLLSFSCQDRRFSSA